MKLKKLSALFCAAVIAVMLCACSAPLENTSSGGISSDIGFSENSSDSLSASSNMQSQTVSSSDSNVQNSSNEQSSSPKRPVRLPTRPSSYSSSVSESSSSASNNSSQSETTTSQTTSSSIANSAINPTKAIGIGVYHFQPYWTESYGTSESDRMQEFKDVIEEGYFNTVIVSPDYATNEKFWKICLDNELSVWMSLFGYYDSSKTTLDKYVNNVEKNVSEIKKNAEWWSIFNGFQYDENIWRGQSNADFLDMTQALYKKWGKRNFLVLATGEFTAYEGNQNQIDMDAANMKKVNPKALKYVTDIAFDSYSVDVRDGAPNGNKYSEWQKVSPNIVDGKSYYSEHNKVLLSLVDHDVNVWFYPCSYTTSLWGGLNGLGRADEDYCLAHLNFFYDLLKKQKYQGGLFLYTYKNNASNPKEFGLQSKLIVEDENGSQILTPGHYDKWEYFSYRLKVITEECRKTKAKQATFNF